MAFTFYQYVLLVYSYSLTYQFSECCYAVFRFRLAVGWLWETHWRRLWWCEGSFQSAVQCTGYKMGKSSISIMYCIERITSCRDELTTNTHVWKLYSSNTVTLMKIESIKSTYKVLKYNVIYCVIFLKRRRNREIGKLFCGEKVDFSACVDNLISYYATFIRFLFYSD